MLIDNERGEYTLYEWIIENTREGELDIVTGYFTIGALNFVSEKLNDNVEKFHFILGDFVNRDEQKEHGVDLLNEELASEGAFQLSKAARTAVDFLKQDKVSIKTLEPNFCHAKAYLYDNKNKKQKKDSWFITGSSNLTEAGIGLRKNHNAELNIADTGMAAQFEEIKSWFASIWNSDKAKDFIEITNPVNGKKEKKNFKEYLIEEIQKVFKIYTPADVYYKILFELFGAEITREEQDEDFKRTYERLKDTKVYNTLYPFQKRGVDALIKKLLQYNGAILGDAVGLGKTWSALAVIKYFDKKGYKSIVLCPKKIHQNWEKFLEEGNIFSRDDFKYKVRFHTDLQDDRWNRYTGEQKFDIEDFRDDKPKLLIIDESHNLRNHKSGRYRFLMEELLEKSKGNIKILMLSATPINNNLIDIRNQFRLITHGDDRGFYDSIGVRNLNYIFRRAQHSFNEWREMENPKIGDFIKMLPSDFFRLTDSLVVARTRKMVKDLRNNLEFPKINKPDNVFVTPVEIGNIESFKELYEHFPHRLSGYQPSRYLEEQKTSAMQDEQQRDFFLVKMMYILMVKRLESSWYSFKVTIERVLEHHQNALDRIKQYQKTKAEQETNEEAESLMMEDEELAQELEQFTLGKKRLTKLTDIDEASNIEKYKEHLKDDIEKLQFLVNNLDYFQKEIQNEIKQNGHKDTKDSKLEALMEKIEQKRQNGFNNDNQKVVIFTAYKDTGEYLYEQMKERGYQKLAFVSGDYSYSSWSDSASKKYEPILQQFAPFTKLFREKEWKYKPSQPFMNEQEEYDEWKDWIYENYPDTGERLNQPIDILIATDALSEGQNLQDSDMVINYDIHWNPVRIIQRMGRIDRLGTPNKEIFGINFWPSQNINNYLDLQGRIEQRMAAMKLAGSEVNHDFSDTFRDIAQNDELEQKQKEKMLRQMETTLDDLEEETENLGMDDLSLEKYRQLLYEELEKSKDVYRNMPRGVYSGFTNGKGDMDKQGLVALLGYPARVSNKPSHTYKEFELIYVDQQGNPLLMNQKEVLEGLTESKDNERFIPDDIDKGEPEALSKLQNAISNWLEKQAVEETEMEDGSTQKRMGSEAKDILQKMKHGDKKAMETVKSDQKLSDKYKAENYDLIAWYVISE